MIKRLGILFLVFLIAFYPAAAFAQETDESVDVEETEEEMDEQEVEDAESESEKDSEVDVETNEDHSTDSETNEDSSTDSTSEEDSSKEDSSKEESTDEEPEVSEEEANDVTESDEEVEEEVVEEESEEEQEETEAPEEELDLKEIYGTAKARTGTSIEYDFNKGYYVLDLQVGLSNFSKTQVIKQKWMAFALPDGVYVPDVEDLPSGMIGVTLYDGSNGLAFKIPDVQEFPEAKYVYHKLPLMGEPNDNNPNLNLYLLDVDVDAMQYEDLGQLKSQRDIDFSPMIGEPVLDVDASITGETSFDEENRHYVLDLNVNATNNTDSSLESIYAGIELPEGVEVVDNESTPKDIVQIKGEDGSRTLAVKLPAMKAGKGSEVNYQIPTIGKTDVVVEDSTINTYIVEGNSYQDLAQVEGTIKVDFSSMNKAWDFSAVSQIVKDYPGLEPNQFALNFAFSAQNLTVNNVDAIEVEFNVPDHLKIHKPDSYNQAKVPDSLKDFMDQNSEASSDLDITWDGNTALINLDTMKGSQWNQGFFSAFGESTKSLSELEGLNVTVKLLQDGEVVEETDVPFEVVTEDGDSAPEPEEPGDETPKPEKPGDETPKPEKPGDETPKPEKPGDETPKPEKPKDPTPESNDDDKNDSDDEIVIEDNNNTVGGDDSTNGDKEGTLPATATNMFTLILVGSILSIAGGVMFIFRRRVA